MVLNTRLNPERAFLDWCPLEREVVVCREGHDYINWPRCKDSSPMIYDPATTVKNTFETIRIELKKYVYPIAVKYSNGSFKRYKNYDVSYGWSPVDGIVVYRKGG